MPAPLQLIPVLDLMAGQVVHARAGQRDTYRPLQSVLCNTSKPLDVVAGLLDLHPFLVLYVADLDAILGRGNHWSVLSCLRNSFPKLRLWVDSGFKGTTEAREWQALELGQAVLGSESLTSLPRQEDWPAGGVLSLDYFGAEYRGPNGLPEQPAFWPGDVIAMTLGRVGLAEGPDISRLKHLRALSQDARLYAAGGVRNETDFDSLIQAGANGVLLASALHDGTLNRARLDAFHLRHSN